MTTTPETLTPPAPEMTPSVATKPTFSKALAAMIAVAVLLIAVLTIAVVQLLPQAFGSLASLYETLHSASSDRTLEVSVNKEGVKSGESVTLSWATTSPAGTYTFSYACSEDALAVEIRKADGPRNVRCDTVYSLGETAAVELVARTEKSEPVTVAYTLGFLRTNDTSPRASHSGKLVVTSGLAEANPTPEPSEPAAVATSDEDGASDEPAIETPLVRIETPQIPSFRGDTSVTSRPTSDANGYVDLATRFVAIGTMNGSSFSTKTTLSTKSENALRFEVFNYGTKTSNSWSYKVNLPDGTTYQSGSQVPLRPNERTTITIGFAEVDKTDSSVKASVSVKTTGDIVDFNDRFTKTLKVKTSA